MKSKIPAICLGTSLVLNIGLAGFLIQRGPSCEYTHLNEIDRTKDVIPNEETARKMAEVYLDDFFYFHKDMELPYDAEITFDEAKYEWTVLFYLKEPEDGGMWLDGSWFVKMRRDYGIATDFGR